MHFRSLIGSVAMLVLSATSQAQDYRVGEMRIDHPYARATMPGQTSGAAYLTLENKGKNSDKLVSITSPAAKSVEIHTMSMEGNVMKMREVSHIEIKPGAKVTMKPGDGYHIMLVGIQQPLKAGDQVPLTLNFEKSGKVEVSAQVADKGAKAAGAKGDHHHHRH
jgi:copper(I)-binding protein